MVVLACWNACAKPSVTELSHIVPAGKFYTLTTGASERRWGKMKDRLQGTIKSFSILF